MEPARGRESEVIGTRKSVFLEPTHADVVLMSSQTRQLTGLQASPKGHSLNFR